MKQKFLIVAMTCIAILSGCTDQPVATGMRSQKFA